MISTMKSRNVGVLKMFNKDKGPLPKDPFKDDWLYEALGRIAITGGLTIILLIMYGLFTIKF